MQIYTDVDGVYTADPRIVPDARKLKTVTFEEMLEMASLGSKVLQIRSVEFAGKYKVRLRVLSSFEEEGEGTLITFEEDEGMEQAIISGIAASRDEAKITVLGVPDRPGIAYQILGPVGDANVDVDMIVQNVGHDGVASLTFTVPKEDAHSAVKVLPAVFAKLGGGEVAAYDNIAKLSVVGVGMRTHAGVAAALFTALAEKGINIELIATSEIKITVAIARDRAEEAQRTAHAVFKLEAQP